ncbi:MAG: type III-B CRISPR-associated protein Cas10/Cmr2 [Armatimonadetes bacterium]|nr:type III-B CRISPR-associated protein Cas10/Cmr2 [Armatimonadota bacterium]
MTSFFSEKLRVFFHDSLDKPFVLLSGRDHFRHAQEMAQLFGIQLQEGEAGDHLAAAMERVFLPAGAGRKKELQVNFLDEGEIRHPLTGYCWDRLPQLLNSKDPGLLKDRLSGILKKVLSRIVSQLPTNLGKISDEPIEKKLFFFLWRNLQEEVKKDTPLPELKKLWDIAVADTRLPDHSLFEHLQTATAFGRSEYIGEKLYLKATLVLFSLGPVQGLLAQSRKLADLYWSSFLLSYLSFTALSKIVDNYGPDAVIYPDLYGQPFFDWWLEKIKGMQVTGSRKKDLKMPTIPNRFLAVIPESQPENVTAFLKELEGSVRRELSVVAEGALEAYQLKKPPGFDAQVENLLEIYWVALTLESGDLPDMLLDYSIKKVESWLPPKQVEEFKELAAFLRSRGEYPPNSGLAYALLFKCLDRMMGVRKSIRNFSPLVGTGRKCANDGERDVLFYLPGPEENSDAVLKSDKLFSERTQILREHKKISSPLFSPGEGLCAVCLTKRLAAGFFQKKFGLPANFPSFPSTADMALSHLEEAAGKDAQLKELLVSYKRYFGEAFDSQFLYEENLSEASLLKNGITLGEKEKKEVVEHQKQIIKYLKKKGLALCRYYALISLDGDDMGKWLAGEFAPDCKDVYHPKVWENLPQAFQVYFEKRKRPLTPALHRTVSRALRDYALEFVSRIIKEENRGRIVYAGGDDLLAVVNLCHLFEAMSKLRAAFSGHCNAELDVDFTKEASGFVEQGEKISLLLGEKASLSGSIVIAHYKTPLSCVMRVLHTTREQAKSVDGKNAYCLCLLRRAGELREVTLKWTVEPELEKEGSCGVLKKVFDFLREEKISTRFVAKLENEFLRLSWGYGELIKGEINRLALRSVGESFKKEKEKISAELTDALVKLPGYLPVDRTPPLTEMESFLNALRIVTFLAQETSLQEGESK